MEANIDNGELLDYNKVHELTGYAVSYLRKLVMWGKIPCYKPFGRKVFFRKSEIVECLLQNRYATIAEIEAHM